RAISLFALMTRLPPVPTLFPYTTLFRSADPLLFEVKNDVADIVDSKRIDPGKRFVQQDVARICGEASRDLDTATLTAGKRIASGLSNMFDAELLEQLL